MRRQGQTGGERPYSKRVTDSVSFLMRNVTAMDSLGSEVLGFQHWGLLLTRRGFFQNGSEPEGQTNRRDSPHRVNVKNHASRRGEPMWSRKCKGKQEGLLCGRRKPDVSTEEDHHQGGCA